MGVYGRVAFLIINGLYMIYIFQDSSNIRVSIKRKSFSILAAWLLKVNFRRSFNCWTSKRYIYRITLYHSRASVFRLSLRVENNRKTCCIWICMDYYVCTIQAIPDSKVHGGPHGAHLGPIGPRWAPCGPHELCYLGYHAVAHVDLWTCSTCE